MSILYKFPLCEGRTKNYKYKHKTLFFSPYDHLLSLDKDIFILFIYSFSLERVEGRENERERNIDEREKHLLVASHTHRNQRSNPQPRHVP